MNSAVAKAANVPLLTPMEEDKLRRRIDTGKRTIKFFIKMTSGVVYSLVMHYVIITAYALLIFQIFHTNEFDLDLLAHFTGSILILYVPFIVLEIGCRWVERFAEPLLVIKSGHLAHLAGCMMLLPTGTISLDRKEMFIFASVWISLGFWTFFVIADAGILAILEKIEEDFLTQPLLP